MARPGSSLAFMATGLGPRVVFAPEGIADVGGGGDGGDQGGGNKGGAGGDDGKAKSGAETGADKGGAGDDKGKGGEKPLRPDWLPESIWDADKGFKADDFNALVSLKAETDSRRASVPEKADKYAVKLPADFKLPEGFELKDGEKLIDETDPRVAKAREWAHANGKTQAEFEGLLALGAEMDIAERGRLKEAVTEERNKLGGRAVERIKAVTTWLDAKLGAEDAASLHSMMFTAKQISAFERLMQLNRGDVPGRPGAGREAKPAEVSDEEWAKMTPIDRINYAREHSPAPKRK